MGLVVCLLVGMLSVSCRREVTRTEFEYPQPRYPRYLVHDTKDDYLKAARFAVRQPVGRSPLGKIQSGQDVYVMIEWGQDMEVWEAIQQAWAEKGVTAHALPIWEVLGIAKEEFYRRMEPHIVYGNEGWKEAGIFLRKDYKPYFSEEIQKQFGDPITYQHVIDPHLVTYLDQHPEIQHIYGGGGGGVFFQDDLGPKHADKFEGNWIYIHPEDLLSKAAQFPADVWSLVDEKILRPIPFVSEATFQDPEGTNLHWNLTLEQSQLWSRSSGGSNHLYIYPNPLHSTLQEGGVLVAHANHTGMYPTMTIHLDRYGAVERIEGGGRVAEMFRYLLNHPNFKDVNFPKAPAPGYWFFRQDGFATNPKFVRSYTTLIKGRTFLANANERNRAGIQHLAFAYSSNDPEDLAYAKEKGVPLGRGEHNFHLHLYFPTVKWQLRDTGEWITVSDKGYVTMFDDPEVRALASRYGDPDMIFRYEWIPAVPGINMEGDYQRDFAPDPWNYMMSQWKQIQEGTYPYLVDDYGQD